MVGAITTEANGAVLNFWKYINLVGLQGAANYGGTAVKYMYYFMETRWGYKWHDRLGAISPISVHVWTYDFVTSCSILCHYTF